MCLNFVRKRTLGEILLLIALATFALGVLLTSLSFIFCKDEIDNKYRVRYADGPGYHLNAPPKGPKMVKNNDDDLNNRTLRVSARRFRPSEEAALMVRTENSDEFVCNMFIITSLWFVTTAKCGFLVLHSSEPFNNFYARVGGFFESGIVIPLVKVLVHPDYVNARFDESVSLVHVGNNALSANPLEFFVEGLESTILATETHGVVIGWGKDEYLGFDLYPEPMRVKISLRDADWCNLRHERVLGVSRNVKFCGVQDNSTEMMMDCLPEEGAALQIDGVTIGLASWGEKCTEEVLPVVFVDLRSFTDWIYDTIINTE